METKIQMIKLKKIEGQKKKLRKKRLYYFIAFKSILFFVIFILFFILFFYPKININIKNQNINYKKKIKLTLSDKLKLLKIYTNNNELRYKGFENCLLNDPDSQKCIYHLILPKNVVGKKRILLGDKSQGDGVYVILDDFEDVKIAYSFGISINIQFDKALANRGIDVFMYDHTISQLPEQNPRFHWFKIGISGKQKHPDLKDLESLLEENMHTLENNMILKLDVEHWEWPALNDLSEKTLNQFKYILVEYHFSDEISNESTMYYRVMKKLATTHQSFYARCNGNRANIIQFGNNRICHIIEVCYIIRKNNIFTYDDTIYPIDEFEYIQQQLNGKLEMNLNILKLFSE